MAKITPSALITDIRGKWHGDTFQVWKGATIVHRTGHPRQRPTQARTNYKQIVSDIAGCYETLTTTQKNSWTCYAALLPTEMSGFNAFLSRITCALLAGHAGLSLYFQAPAVHSTPATPAPLSLAYCASTLHFCVTWTTPNGATYYTQAHYAPQAGFSNQNYPAWRAASTVSAAQLHLDLDASGYPSGTVFRFRARTLNIYAEPSAWSTTLSETKT